MKKNAKLDANTQKQLHEIQQDADIATLVEGYNELVERLITLEEARKAQQKLNIKFLSFIEEQEQEVSAEELINVLRVEEPVESFWQHIKNKLSN